MIKVNRRRIVNMKKKKKRNEEETKRVSREDRPSNTPSPRDSIEFEYKSELKK